MDLKKIALTCAVTSTGLTAGLFFGYQISVIPAFKTLSDGEYIAGMQAINVAIQNPAFGVAFMGPLVFLPLAAFLHRDSRISPRFKFLLLASVLYIIGSLGITFGANVPLNDTLAQFSLHTAQPAQIAMARSAFESSWNMWHMIRTYASVGSLVLLIIACLIGREVVKREPVHV